MRIVLINPPHRAIGSRVPGELLPPLGLLAIGGPLIDAGHEVRLINADIAPMPLPEIIAQIGNAEAVLIGHSGSTSAHPVVLELTAMIRAAYPQVKIIYGGVYPSYHWQDVLGEAPQIDYIVRGEGEVTTPPP
ncbi:cobalamin-dependent protein [Pseudorhodobacter ferrugineus]|uniref:cobalamin-dependent protein n=1 Tax=Pseudorhodobacter ferrugineus TaxID=77008 RepID=UPI00040475AE|nr:cobalamin-dependent protein [Pseudorhodobacter ferrugineus]